MAKTPALPTITEDEAQRLTREINNGHADLCWLIWRARADRIWLAMNLRGFKSWINAHLTMTEVHAYRLWHQADRTRRLEEAAGLKIDPWEAKGHVQISERQLRPLGQQMDDVVRAVRDEMKHQNPAQSQRADVIRDVVRREYERVKAEAESATVDPVTLIARRLDAVLDLIPVRLDRTMRRVWQKDARAKVEQVRDALDRVLAA